MQETQICSLGEEDPLEKEMATHSSTLAWRIPWTEEPGRLQSMRSQRARRNWVTKHMHTQSNNMITRIDYENGKELKILLTLNRPFLPIPHFAAAAAKSLQSCPTLCDPIDGSPPGSPTPGILQARTLEWVAISFSNAWKWKVKVKSLSHVRLFETPWTAAHQAPPSMGFSRQEYWSGVPLPSPYLVTEYYIFYCINFLN